MTQHLLHTRVPASLDLSNGKHDLLAELTYSPDGTIYAIALIDEKQQVVTLAQPCAIYVKVRE